MSHISWNDTLAGIMIDALQNIIHDDTVWMTMSVTKFEERPVWRGKRNWYGRKVYGTTIEHIDFGYTRQPVTVWREGSMLVYDHTFRLDDLGYNGYFNGIRVYTEEHGGEELWMDSCEINTRYLTKGCSIEIHGGTIKFK